MYRCALRPPCMQCPLRMQARCPDRSVHAAHYCQPAMLLARPTSTKLSSSFVVSTHMRTSAGVGDVAVKEDAAS